MSFLAPIGWLYGQIMQARNSLYDRGILKSYDLGAKTISVGNITTGGTGKTPLVAYIAEILADNGEKVCILTRGYGRIDENELVLVSDWNAVLADVETSGDEPVELARKLLGKAIVVADADRLAAANWANARFGITAFVLDDGFQYRRAKRDLDIVCIDASDPFGNARMLPAGRLREPLGSLSRADAVVLTKADTVENLAELDASIGHLIPGVTRFRSDATITHIIELQKFHAKTRSLQSNPTCNVFAFAGLANNTSFLKSLETIGIRPIGDYEFRDHHLYAQADVDEIEKSAQAINAHCLITTAKDAVKLERMKFSIPCFVAEIEIVIDDPDRFRDLLLSI